jgi:peroxiredoxin
MSFRRISTALVVASTIALFWCNVALAQRRTTAEVSPDQAAKLLEVLKLGETAKDVEFQPVRGDAKIKLSELTKEGPVVLVVLRGFPGYQCPICTRQVAELRRSAEEFVKLNAKVVLVYPGPGPAESLKQKAVEFLSDSELPKPFLFMVDPEYSFTSLYELRWNARAETSFPSTFVLDTKRVVKFRKISTSHGDRAPTKDVLAALADLQKAAPAAKSTGAGNE